MAKLKFVQDKQIDEYPEPIYIYDEDLKKNVCIAHNKGLHLQQEFLCRDEFFSGTKLLEIKGDTKLIIEYEDVRWPDEKFDKYWALRENFEFPYKKVDDVLVNVVPVEDIIKYSKKITIYTTHGKKILEILRGMVWDYRILNFDIKFKKDYFVFVESRSLYESIELEKTVYSYSGKVLSKKKKDFKVNELIKKEITKEDFEIIK